MAVDKCTNNLNLDFIDLNHYTFVAIQCKQIIPNVGLTKLDTVTENSQRFVLL